MLDAMKRTLDTGGYYIFGSGSLGGQS